MIFCVVLNYQGLHFKTLVSSYKSVVEEKAIEVLHKQGAYLGSHYLEAILDAQREDWHYSPMHMLLYHQKDWEIIYEELNLL